MAQISGVWREANELIEKFRKEFESKYGFKLVIHFKTKSFESLPPLSLQEILDEIESLLDTEYPDKQIKSSYGIVNITNGIRTNTRVYQIVLLRQIFCYIAHELGYTSVEIGRFIHKDHATVLHSIKTLKIALDLKVKSVMGKYEIVKSSLVVKYGKSEGSQEQGSDSTGSSERDPET